MKKNNQIGLARRLTLGTLIGALSIGQVFGPLGALAETNLDLGSQTRTVPAAASGLITIGGHLQSVTHNQLLTPAEATALQQVMASGRQQLTVGAGGNATGGSLLVTNTSQPGGGIVVPSGVVLRDAATVLNLTGNLVNSGTIFASPLNFTSSSLATMTINAANIFNQVGGVITTVPLTGTASAPPVNLILSAVSNIVNAGRISSSGDLTLSAGGTITNALPSGVTGPQPVMQAANNINFVLGNVGQSASLINAGLITATTGSINIASQNIGNIIVNNAGGTLSALSGGINVRDSQFSGNYDVSLTGGDLLSKEVNIFSGTGNVYVNVDQLTGKLNVSAGGVDELSSTSALHIGNVTTTGDPTFFNQGDIFIDGAIATGGGTLGSLAIVASGNVYSEDAGNVNPGSIDTTGTGAGGPVLIVAGANFSTSPTSSGSSSASGSGDTTTDVTITGGSTGGGSIDLSHLTKFVTNGAAVTAGSNKGFSGGNVTLLAFNGTTAGSGTINAAINNPNGIMTYGTTGGPTGGAAAANGNVLMIAGATADPGPANAALTTGTINAGQSGAASTYADGGFITLETATPQINGNLTIQNGAVISGTSTNAPSAALPTVDLADTTGYVGGANQQVLITGPIDQGGKTVTVSEVATVQSVSAGVSLTLNSLVNSYTGNVTVSSLPTVTATTIQPASIAVVPTGTSPNVNYGDLSTSGAPVTMVAGANISFSGQIVTQGTPNGAAASLGPGGLVTMIAGQNITSTNTRASINTTGGAGISPEYAGNSGPQYSNYYNNSGGSVLLMAGTQVTSTVNAPSVTALLGTLQNPAAGVQPSGQMTISLPTAGASSTGGSIDLKTNAISQFTTDSNNVFQIPKANPVPAGAPAGTLIAPDLPPEGYAGGDVTIVAYQGSTTGSGAVSLPSSKTIYTAGMAVPYQYGVYQTSGGASNPDPATPPASLPNNYPGTNYPNANGNVTILAGGTSGTTISIGNINTALHSDATTKGSNAGAGNITIATAQPQGSLAFYVTDASGLQIYPVSNSLTAGTIQSGAAAIVGNLNAQGGSTYINFPVSSIGGQPTLASKYQTLTTAISVNAGTLTIGNVINPNSSLPADFIPYNVNSGLTPPVWPGLSMTPLPSSSINLSAVGTMTFTNGGSAAQISSPATAIVVNPSTTYGYEGVTGADGGTITISAGSYSGAVSVNADGTGGRYNPPPATPLPSANPPVGYKYPPQPTQSGPATSPSYLGFFPVANANGGNGGVISITSTQGPISVNSTNFVVSAKGDNGSGSGGIGGNGGIVTISAGGALTIDPSSLTAAPAAGANNLPQTNTQLWSSGNSLLPPQNEIPTGNGAIISLSGTTVLISGTLDASGSASTLSGATGYPGGNGGSITINASSSTPFNIGAATTNGLTGSLTATGSTSFGSGGTISVTSGGGIVIQSNSLSVAAAPATNDKLGVLQEIYPAGNGGHITLVGTTVLSNSSLDASGGTSSPGSSNGNPQTLPNGSGGSIYIQTNSSSQFTVSAQNTSTPNGVIGSVTANAGQGSLAKVTGAAPLTMIPGGNGGSVTIINNGSGGIEADSGAISVTAEPANATLQTLGGNGGSISLQAPTGPVLSKGALIVDGGAASTLGTDGGNGGSITIVNSSTTTFTVGTLPGSPVNGVPSLSAQGYTGGTISITSLGTPAAQGGITPQTITVNNASDSVLSVKALFSSSATANAGNGGTIVLDAEGGAVFVGGNLEVNGAGGASTAQGGSAGTIAITSNSLQALTIGQATAANGGIAGTLSANGGSATAAIGSAGIISITNKGGGVTINAAQTSISLTVPSHSTGQVGTAGDGGNLSITAAGAISIGGTLNVSGGSGSTGTNAKGQVTTTQDGLAGSITLVENSTTAFDIGGSTTSQQSANGTGALIASGWNGGTISITNSGSGGIIVENGSITVQAEAANPAENVQNRTWGGAGGSITLNAPAGPVVLNGTLDVSGGAGATATTVTLTNTLPIAANNVLVLSGNISSSDGYYVNQTVLVSNGTLSEYAYIASMNINPPNSDITLYDFLANAYPAGTPVTLSAQTPGGLAGQVSITAGGGITQATGASINANNVNLSNSGSNDIGSAGSPVQINGITNTLPNTSLNTNGAPSGTILPNIVIPATLTVTSGGSAYIANNSANINVATSTAAGNFSLTSTGGIAVTGNITATSGALTLTACQGCSTTTAPTSPGTLAIGAMSPVTLTGGAGAVQLATQDLFTGSIAIGDSSTITAAGPVDIVVGIIPASPTNTTPPTGITVNPTAGGAAYFGTASITANGTNTVNANTSNVVFNIDTSHGLTSSAIVVGTPSGAGGVTINSNPQATPSINITSLDLTNKSVVSYLVSLQQASKIGGMLQVGANGQADGGNIILIPADLTSSLTAENIPSGVTAQFQGFSTSNVVSINTAQPVAINGTESFTSTSGTATINVATTVTSGAFVIGTSPATLTSDGGLSVTVSGSMQIGGVVSTGNNGNLTLTATNGGAVALGANITGAGTTSIVADGNITRSAGTISGTSVSLTSTSGSIGTIGASASAISTTTASLTANATAASQVVNIANIGAVSVGASAAGATFMLSSTGSVTTVGDVIANSVTLQAANGASNVAIALGGNVGNGNGAVTLAATGTGTISQTSGNILATALTLSGGSGDIGSVGTALNTTTGNLTANVGGSGSVYVSNTGSVTLGSSSAGGSFSLTTTGNLTTTDDVTATGGTLSLIAGTSVPSSTLTIGGTNATLTSSGGTMTLQNQDISSTSGGIVISAGTTLTANGNVDIVVGAVPGTPTNTTAPIGITVNASAGGVAYFGAASITANGSSIVNANTANVVFNIDTSNGLTKSAITVNNGVTINSNPASGSINITSLDLQNAGVVSYLTGLQNAGELGGHLIVNGSGIAVGGTITLTPQDGLSNITAEDIPAGVTATFSGFSTSTLHINITSSSTQSSVLINGTEQFTSTTGTPTIKIDSTLASPVLTIGGTLTSDGSLAIRANGGVSIAGPVSTASGGNLTLTTTNGGIVSLGANFKGSGVTTINADGGITQTAGTISGSSVALTSASGSVGAFGGSPVVISTTTSNLSANAPTGVVNIANTGALTLAASAATTNFGLSATGTITTTGAITADSVTLGAAQGANNVGIKLGGNVGDGNGAVTLAASGNGSISQTAGTVNATTLALSSGSGNIGSSANARLATNAGTITVNTLGSAYIGNAATVIIGASAVGNGTTNLSTFDLQSSGPISTVGAITANTINLSGASGSNAGIFVKSAISAVGSGSSITLQADGSGRLSSETPQGILTGATINLISGSGNIGSSTAGGAMIINAAAGPTTLTVSTLGSAYISSNGAISLGASNAGSTATTGSILQLAAAGSITTVGAVGANSVVLSAASGSGGSITMQSDVTGLGSNSSVTLQADGGGTIQETNSFTVTGTNMVLSSGSGNIGTSAAQPLSTATANLSVTTGGVASVYINNAGSVTVASSSLGGAFLFNSTGSITTTGNISTSGGPLTLTAGGSLTTGGNLVTKGGALTLTAGGVSPGSTITIGGTSPQLSGDGNVLIQNNDFSAKSGGIVIGTGTTITAAGTVTIVVGAVPGTPTNTTPPAGVTVNPTPPGAAYFGTSSIQASGSNTINALGANTVFNIDTSNSLSASAIKLNGNVTINSNASASIQIPSLDLTNPAVVASLVSLQGQHEVGGTLIVTNGIATGGNIIFNPVDSLANLSAENIPAGVNVSFQNFVSAPVNVNITASSTTKQVVINGFEQFIQTTPGQSSGGIINITSTQAGPVLNIGSTGRLSSDGSLAVTAGGSILSNGYIGAVSNLNLTASNGGTIALNGPVYTLGTATINAAGNISQSSNAQIIAGVASLTSTSGNIGGTTTPIQMSTGVLTANAPNGLVAVSNSAQTLLLGASSASTTLQVISSGAIAVTGNLSGAGGVIVTSINDSIGFSNNVAVTGNLTLNALTGSLSVNNGQTLSVTGKLIGNTAAVFNPSAFTATLPPVQFNITPNSGVGVIANSNGDVNLTPNMLINTGGKNLAIIASGNVYATGVGVINLSGARGGNLFVLAGFDFDPQTVGQTLSTTTTYTSASPSVTGGSINLANTAIYTYGTGTIVPGNGAGTGTVPAGANGGYVFMVANKGTTSQGVILTNQIYTASTNGFGGPVLLIAPGGVVVNGPITTTGALGGGGVAIGTYAVSPLPNIQLLNGLASPSTSFIPGSVAATAVPGAAIVVNGAITTTASAGVGGPVLLSAESQIQSTGAIQTSGLIASGFVALNSLNGAVTQTGGINASGFGNNSTGNTFNGALASAVSIQAPEFITVNGNITANGGYAVGSNNGGAAGSVFLGTTNTDHTGDITVNGYINASGGTAYGTGSGGQASSFISISSGAFQVTGGLTAPNGVAASILASPGSGSTASGIVYQPSTVMISSYAVQDIPANFNLSSSTNSETALPGGVMKIGVPSNPLLTNGTTYAIVIGSTTVNNQTYNTTGSQHPSSNITLTINGTTTQTISAGGSKTIHAGDSVTPGEALALYQVTGGGGASGQTVNLNGSGQVTDGSTLTTPESELPTAFSSFVLSTQTATNNVQLAVTGTAPMLNLPSAVAAVINGQINFSTAANVALINAGSQALTIGSTGVIQSANQLAVLVPAQAINNNGTLTASQLLILNPYSTVALTNGSTGTINANASAQNPGILLIPGASPSNFYLSNNGGTLSQNVLFSQQQLPTGYTTAVVQALTPGAPSPNYMYVDFTLAKTGNTQQTAVIGGTLANVPALYVATAVSPLSKVGTPLAVLSGTNFSATNVVSLASSEAITVGSSTQLSSANEVEITGAGTVTIGAGTQLVGGLTTSGSVVITGGQSGILINSPNTSIEAGSVVELKATAGAIQVNGSNTFAVTNANGAVYLLAPTSISLGAGSSFAGSGEVYVQATSGNVIANGTKTSPITFVSNAEIELLSQSTLNMTYGNLTSSGSGFIYLASGTGTTVANSNLNAGSSLTVAATGAMQDNGSNTYRATNGRLYVQGSSIGIGNASAGSSLNAPNSYVQLAGTNGSITLNGGSTVATQTSISGQLVYVTTAGTGSNITTTNTSVAATQSTITWNATGNVVDNGGSTFSAATTLSASGQNLTLGTGSSMTGLNGVTLTATSTSGLMAINGNITAGQLTAAPTPGTVIPLSQISKFGAINLTAYGALTIETGATPAVITANGGNVLMYAVNGAIQMGASNQIAANGGNIIMLASGKINGSTGNSFTAYAYGTPGASTGGGIELGAGTLTSFLGSAASQTPGTKPAANLLSSTHPAQIQVNNPTSGANQSGVVMVNDFTGGSVNLATSGSNNATLTLTKPTNGNGGAIVFDSVGANNTVQLDGATFSVTAFQPIGYTYSVAPAVVVDSDDAQATGNQKVYQLAHLFVDGCPGAQLLTGRGTADADSASGQRDGKRGSAVITMTYGEMFMHLLQNTTIRSPLAEVHAKKGALVSVSVEGRSLRVIACSGPGEVAVMAGDREIKLAPGQEVLVSDFASPSGSAAQRADGVGRRRVHTYPIGAHLYATVSDVSLVSMLNNMQNLQALKNPATDVEKTISNRLIKTAAVIEQVTRGNGQYLAIPAARSLANRSHSVLTPVNYVHSAR